MTFNALRWLAVVLMGMTVAQAVAQPFPGKGIRVVVPYPPGGFNDVVTRVLVQGFNEGFAPGSYADNKPGAGTVIGTELVAKSAPDGYTILVVSFPFSVMNALYPASKVDVIKDFAALNYVGYAPSLLVANSATPYKTVGELIEAAKAKPATLLYASTSNGSSAHLFMELFKSLTKTSLVHVPYKGNGPAISDLLGGHIPMMFLPIPVALGNVKAGTLRALAITSAKRSALLPDVPTVAESVPGFEVALRYGLAAPAGTPPAVIARLNKELNAALAAGDVKTRLTTEGAEALPGTPEIYAADIAAEEKKYGGLVKKLSLKVE